MLDLNWKLLMGLNYCIEQCGVTGKSSQAWVGKPSSGRRWSNPSGHIPTGTLSSLEKKDLFNFTRKKTLVTFPGATENPWTALNCVITQCKGAVFSVGDKTKTIS